MQFRKGTDVPPGYDPDASAKPKTKAAKKNEKRKEKKQQVIISYLGSSLPPTYLWSILRPSKSPKMGRL